MKEGTIPESSILILLVISNPNTKRERERERIEDYEQD